MISLLPGLAAATMLSLAMGAAAQTTPAKPAPAAPAASPPSAPATPVAAPPTPGQVAAARELVVVSGISRSFDVLIPQFMDQLGTSLTQTRPDLIRDLNTVMTNLKPEFDKQTDEMVNLAGDVYVRLMSEQELKAAVAFFKSDAGRKYVDSQPAFMAGAVGVMQAWQTRIASHMVERVREEMRKKGHEI